MKLWTRHISSPKIAITLPLLFERNYQIMMMTTQHNRYTLKDTKKDGIKVHVITCTPKASALIAGTGLFHCEVFGRPSQQHDKKQRQTNQQFKTNNRNKKKR